MEDAAQKAAQADVAVVFAGLTETYESEGFDRSDMKMPEGHIRMIEAVSRANPNTVVVLMCGCAVECPWETKVKGLLYAGLCGQAGAEAIADVLYGKVNPSGKLAESWPLRYQDCISSGDYAKQKDALYKEGIYVGYRYYDSAKKKVRYPFGYGLSYTSFAYDDLRIEKEDGHSYTVVCNVTNTGDMAGKEIVQLYVAAEDSRIFRPEKELKGFTKIDLQAGQTKQVKFLLDERSFSIYLGKTYGNAFGSPDMARGWVAPEGKYQIMIGCSSRDIRLSETIAVDGERIDVPEWQKGSWYETLEGEPSQQEFEHMLGRTYHPVKRHKGEFTLDDTVKDMKEESLLMKFMYRAVRAVIKRGLGGKITEDNEADFRMLMASTAESPIRSMMISGGMGNGLLPGMVDIANGHFLHGIGRMIGLVK